VTVAEASLTLDVVTAFYDAVLADRLVTIARAALDQADTTLGQTRLRREVGTAPEFDLLRAGVARDNLRPAVIEAEARREIAHLRLRQLLDLPAGQPIALEATLGPDGYLHGPTLTALLADQADTTGERRAAVRQADAAVTAREALLTVARGETLPTLQISSQYGRVAYPSAALPDWNEFLTNWTVNLGLQVPLFTGGRLRAGREVAQASLDEATLRRQQAVEGAALDARTALAGRDATEAIWRASAGTVDQATRAYQIAEIRYQEGLSTQTELLDARLALQQAEANQAMAARNLAVARVRLALLPDLPLAGATNSTALPSAPPGSALPTTAPPSTGPGLP
jgi:outer membrane protein TolC